MEIEDSSAHLVATPAEAVENVAPEISVEEERAAALEIATPAEVEAQPASSAVAPAPKSSPSADDDDAEDEEDVPVDENGNRWKKDRVAVIFGYVGSRFQGLQKNPGAYAVEDDLEKAIHLAGGISKKNYGDLHKVGWNRAARTDKGVHAAGQVVSLKMLCPKGDPSSMPARINAHLPADLRVHEVLRVTRGFNSKNMCSQRQYEYLLPTFMLAPHAAVIAPSKAPPMSQAMKNAVKAAAASVVARAAAGGDASDPYVTGAAASAAAAEARAGRVAALARAEAAHAAAGAAVAASEAAAGVSSSSSSASAPSSCGPYLLLPARSPGDAVGCAVFAPALAGQVDDYTTGGAGARAAAEARAGRAAAVAGSDSLSDGGGSFRLRQSVWARLSEAVGAYVGTRAFHNFTPKLTFGDASAVRFIKEARVSQPFLVTTSSVPVPPAGAASAAAGGDEAMGGAGASSSSSSSSSAGAPSTATTTLEYVKFTFIGQSFLFNQIRHMVGLVVDVARGSAPGHMMAMAFSQGVVRLPLAPAEGLYLDHCFFAHYDKKFGAGPGGKASLTFLAAPAVASKTSFKESVIWPTIAAQVVHERPFHKYLSELCGEPLSYRVHMPAHLASVVAASATAVRAAEERKRRYQAANGEEGGEGEGDPSKRARLGADFFDASEALLRPASLALFLGGPVSKVAKEKTEYKRRLAEEKKRMQRERATARAAGKSQGWDQDRSKGDDEDDEGSSDSDGAGGSDGEGDADMGDAAGAQRGGGGNRGRGGRGGRGGWHNNNGGGGGRGGRGGRGGGRGGGKSNGKDTCFNCRGTGHYSRDCPQPRRPRGDAPAGAAASASAPAPAPASSE